MVTNAKVLGVGMGSLPLLPALHAFCSGKDVRAVILTKHLGALKPGRDWLHGDLAV